MRLAARLEELVGCGFGVGMRVGVFDSGVGRR